MKDDPYRLVTVTHADLGEVQDLLICRRGSGELKRTQRMPGSARTPSLISTVECTFDLSTGLSLDGSWELLGAIVPVRP